MAKEVVDFGEHEARYVACASPINGVAEQPVIRRALDEIVD
jgi:hypothetical protein